MIRRPPRSTLFPYTRSSDLELALVDAWVLGRRNDVDFSKADEAELLASLQTLYAENYADAWRTAISRVDRKSTRLNSSHVRISYAVFCLKKKNKKHI